MPTQYQYVDTSGNLQTTNDQSNAPNIAPHSGFAAINSSTFQPTQASNVPSYTAPDVPKIPSVEDLINQSNQPTAETVSAQNGVNDTLAQIKSLYDFQGTQSSEKARLENQAGVPDLTGQLNEINNQIRGINSSAFSATQNADNRRAPTFQIYGEQAQIERQRSAQTYGLAAASQALQGNIALANDNVQRALDAEFGGLQSKIDYQTQLLNVNRDNLSKAEKKQADALQIRLNDRQNQLDQAKADKATIYNVMTEAAKAGASNATLQAIQNATDPASAIKAAGSALAASNNDFVKLPDGSTVLVNKATGKVVSSFGGGGGNTKIPESVVRTVGKTPVTGYTLQAGDDPYLIAQANGTDMATLQKLNPGITDWTKLPVGATINLPDASQNWLQGKSDSQVAAYNALPDDAKASVKQLVTGDALLSDLVKSRGTQGTTYIKQLINAAVKIDPNWSANLNKQRYLYKQQFNNPNGSDQTQINSINTGLGHLAEFAKASKAIGNTTFQDYNALKNYVAKHAGDENISNLDVVVSALGSELAAIYKGKGNSASLTEIKDWKDKISKNMSQSQSQGFLNTTSSLISSKISSLNDSYKNVVGSYPDSSIVNPSVIQNLIDSGADVSGIISKLKQQGYQVPSTPSSGAVDSTLGQYGIPQNVDSFLQGYGIGAPQ